MEKLTRENMQGLVRIFVRKGIVRKTILRADDDLLVMPKEFHDTTTEMCADENQTFGIMVCQADTAGVIHVKALIPLARGTSLGVSPDKDVADAIKLFRQKYYWDIFIVTWHTHTIAMKEVFFQSFSSEEMDLLFKIVKTNPKKFIHVLFTPTCVLMCSPDRTRIVVKDYPDPEANENFKLWKERFEEFLPEKTFHEEVGFDGDENETAPEIGLFKELTNWLLNLF